MVAGIWKCSCDFEYTILVVHRLHTSTLLIVSFWGSMSFTPKQLHPDLAILNSLILRRTWFHYPKIGHNRFIARQWLQLGYICAFLSVHWCSHLDKKIKDYLEIRRENYSTNQENLICQNWEEFSNEMKSERLICRKRPKSQILFRRAVFWK